MVLKRSVCGLNTGGRVSRRCVALLRHQQALSAAFVQKSIDLPGGLRSSDAGDRERLLADATGAPLAAKTSARQGLRANENEKENRSLHALDFSDGRLEVSGSRVWFGNERELNHAVSAGSSTQFSLNRAKRWELFDRLYDAIEKRKRAARERPVVDGEEKKPQRPPKRRGLRKRAVRSTNLWDDDDDFVPNNVSTAKKAPLRSYLPFRVRATVKRPYPNFRRPRPEDPIAVAFLDSHAAHCTAVRVARDRSFMSTASAQQRAETHSPKHAAGPQFCDEPLHEEEVDELERVGGNLAFLGSSRPDLSDGAKTAESVSNFERRKRARALHHNQHFRGVQRPERLAAETKRALDGCKRVKRHSHWFEVRSEESASAEPDVPPLPTITFDITEPRPVTAESAFLFEKFARSDRKGKQQHLHMRMQLASDVLPENNGFDVDGNDEFADECGHYRSLPHASTKLVLVAPDVEELWEEWPADELDVVSDADAASGFCLSDPLEFPLPSTPASSGVCTRSTPSRASTRNNTETGSSSCCFAGNEDVNEFPARKFAAPASSGSPYPSRSLSPAYSGSASESESDGCPDGSAVFSRAVSFSSLFVKPNTATSPKPRRRLISSEPSGSQFSVSEGSVPHEKDAKATDDLGTAFGWKARVFADPNARPVPNVAEAPTQAAAAENGPGPVARVEVSEERVEQVLQAYLAADAEAVGDELRVLRSALAHPPVSAFDGGRSLAFEARGLPKPVYLLLRQSVDELLVVSHSASSWLADEEVDESVFRVHVKSADFEGPLSALIGAEALEKLEEPVTRLDSIAALALSALDATSVEEPADRQSAAGESETLVPRHWSQRDLNVRYAGRLEGLGSASLAGSGAGHCGHTGQVRALCEPISIGQLVRAAETGAAMETSSASVNYAAAECGICLEIVPADVGVHMQLECGHCFCLRCLLRYMLLAARNPDGPVLKCPAYRCDHAVPSGLCAALLPLSDWQELLTKQTELAIAQRSCVRYCPNVRCRSLLHCDAADVCECRAVSELSARRPVSVVCAKCRYHFCVRCGKPGHWPAACADAAAFESMLVSRADDLSDLLDDSVHFYMARVKRCPSCRQPMEKNSGCQHMKCRCSYEFCWECLESWDSHINGNWKCQSGDGIVPLQIIEIGPETANKFFLQQFFYRRALLFRKSYRWAAMTGMQVELNLKRLQSLQFVASSSDSVSELQELLGGGFQEATDSFYLLQWFFAALISTSRRRFVQVMRQAGLQMNALTNAARSLFRATSQLAFDSSIDPLPSTTQRALTAADNDDGDRERTVALKWAAQLEATLRRQMRERQFLSFSDVRVLCERLHCRTPTRRPESGSLGTLGLSASERRVAHLHERLESFLAVRAICKRQYEQSVLQLRALDLAAPTPAKAASRSRKNV